MSLRMMLWALEEASVDDPTELLVLIALAERADENGRDAFPSREWLAERARVSVRTVTRRLNSLEGRGVISRGDQEKVAHIRADQRPIVWDIPRGDNLSRGVTPGSTTCHLGSNDVSPEVERRVTVDTQTVLNRPRNVLEPTDEQFEQWWKLYPRKNAKGAGRTAFKSALKKVSFDELMIATRLYADARSKIPVEDRKFTPYPSRWLNAEMWLDIGASGAGSAIDELVTAEDVVGLQTLTGIRCPLPDFGDVSPAESAQLSIAFWRDWVVEQRDALIAAAVEKGGV